MKTLPNENYDGVNPSYLISNEKVDLSKFVNQIAKLQYGSFYKEGLVVRDVKGTELTYRLADLDTLATRRSGKEVYRTLIITMPTETLMVSYYAVGGLHLTGGELIARLEEKGFTENNGVSWNDVVNKPTHFPAKDHTHLASELYGFDGIISELNTITGSKSRINLDILNGKLANTRNELTELVESLSTSSSDILEREFEKNKHQDGEIVYLDRWLNANDVIGGGTWSKLVSPNGVLIPNSGSEAGVMASPFIGGIPTLGVSAWVKSSSVPTPATSTLSVAGGLKGTTLDNSSKPPITTMNDDYQVRLTYTGSEPRLRVSWRVINRRDREVAKDEVFRGWNIEGGSSGDVLIGSVDLTPNAPVTISFRPTRNRVQAIDDYDFIIDGYLVSHQINLNKITGNNYVPEWKAYSDYQCRNEIKECHEGDVIFIKKVGPVDDGSYSVNWEFSEVPFTEVATTHPLLFANQVNRWVVGVNRANGKDRLLNVFIAPSGQKESMSIKDTHFNLQLKVRDRVKPVNMVFGLDYTVAGEPIGLSISDGGLSAEYELEVRSNSHNNAPKRITAGKGITFTVDGNRNYSADEKNIIVTILVKSLEDGDVIGMRQFALVNKLVPDHVTVNFYAEDRQTLITSIGEDENFYIAVTDSVTRSRKFELTTTDELDNHTYAHDSVNGTYFTNISNGKAILENGKLFIPSRTTADKTISVKDKVIKARVLLEGGVEPVYGILAVRDTLTPDYNIYWSGLDSNNTITESNHFGDERVITLRINDNARRVRKVKLVPSRPEDVTVVKDIVDFESNNEAIFHIRVLRDVLAEEPENLTFDAYAIINDREYKWFTTNPITINDTSRPMVVQLSRTRQTLTALTEEYAHNEDENLTLWLNVNAENTVPITKVVLELEDGNGNAVKTFKTPIEVNFASVKTGVFNWGGDFTLTPIYTGEPNSARPDKIVVKTKVYSGSERDYLVSSFENSFRINKRTTEKPAIDFIIYKRHDSSKTPVTALEENVSYVLENRFNGTFFNCSPVVMDEGVSTPYYSKHFGGKLRYGALAFNHWVNIDRTSQPRIFDGLEGLSLQGYFNTSNPNPVLSDIFTIVPGRKTWTENREVSIGVALVQNNEITLPRDIASKMIVNQIKTYPLINTSKTPVLTPNPLEEAFYNTEFLLSARLVDGTLNDSYAIRISPDSEYKGDFSISSNNTVTVSSFDQVLSWRVLIRGAAITRPNQRLKFDIVNTVIDEVVGVIETVLKQDKNITSIGLEYISSYRPAGGLDQYSNRLTHMMVNVTDTLKVTLENLRTDDIATLVFSGGRLPHKFKEPIAINDRGSRVIDFPITPIIAGEYNPQTDNFVEFKLSTLQTKLEKILRIPIFDPNGIELLQYRDNVYFEKNGAEVDFLRGGESYNIVVKKEVLELIRGTACRIKVIGPLIKAGSVDTTIVSIPEEAFGRGVDFKHSISIPNHDTDIKNDIYRLELEKRAITGSENSYVLLGKGSRAHPVIYMDIKPVLTDVYLSLSSDLNSEPLVEINEGTTYYLHVKGRGLGSLASSQNNSEITANISFSSSTLSIDHFRFEPPLSEITEVKMTWNNEHYIYHGVAGPYKIVKDYSYNRS